MTPLELTLRLETLEQVVAKLLAPTPALDVPVAPTPEVKV